jgi:hypothetical protein
MRVYINSHTYAEWISGALTINIYTLTAYGDDATSKAWGPRWANTDCISCGYDKRPTQVEAFATILRYHDLGVYFIDSEGMGS